MKWTRKKDDSKELLERNPDRGQDKAVIFPNNAPGEFVAAFFGYYGVGEKGYLDVVEFSLAFTDEGFEETFGADMPRLHTVAFPEEPDPQIIALGTCYEQAVTLTPDQQQKMYEVMLTHVEDSVVFPGSNSWA